jgi:hypothetical protein
MTRERQSSYLEEVLAGGYSDYSEDRLSQIFCASFNHSNRFKKIFLDLVKLNNKSHAALTAQTQISYGLAKEDARIDVIIYKNKKPYIVIENKVEAPLTNVQLGKYDKIHDLDQCKKIAIVKHYFDNVVRGQWKVYHWADLYSALKMSVDSGICNPIDNFVVSNFVEYLELMNMSRVNQISKSELTGFSKAIYKLRNKKYISLTNRNVFETGNQLLSTLEEVIDLVRQEQILTKCIGRNFRFTPNIGSWWQEEKIENNLSITVGISVPKTKNKIKYLGTGFFFYDDDPKKYDIMTYAQLKGGGEFIKVAYYYKKDLVTDVYAKEVISYWKKWVTAKSK